ncbi:Dicer-like protein-like protein [Emericellopsis cladophorae]|uniref:Dicer-like protein-like protein n=1 Tax=Emericellopsis cladophorae TaxID=2686198 RepID=A0A9Q0BE56_9HYPO|nr:Dicer-like protein-like protein [Emericellopsis cladophorae]KAI6781506.1 Dicer-like protein-like protein [Emericellopsis cladophorae]
MSLHICTPVLEGDSTESSRSESPDSMSLDSLTLEESGNVDGDSCPDDNADETSLVEDSIPESPDMRAYQQEMLLESMKGNVIVSMETGSGKTRIAIERMQRQLETGDPRQCEAVKRSLPAYSVKLLTGDLELETWTVSTWKAILGDAQVIVSTPQVLYDALCHGEQFVSFGRLSILVFDEAHKCVKKDAGRKIMLGFYHERKCSGKSVPVILGLTASPSIRATMEGIEHLETTLNARCVWPTLHREELLKYVNKPRLYPIVFEEPEHQETTPSMRSLQKAWQELDLRSDPYILKLLSNPSARNRQLLETAICKSNTYSQTELRSTYARCVTVAKELGLWAADQYIWRATTEFLRCLNVQPQIFDEWSSQEKEYLAAAFRRVHAPEPPKCPTHISGKAGLLLQELLQVQQIHDWPVCLIFAKERATVSMLYELLNACPPIKERYRIGAVVGTSNHKSKKQNICDLSSNLNPGLSVLEDFRVGQVNLLITTSVLEEGIDVPDCNTVICFDIIESLKSFVQRRGRARMHSSKIVIFTDKSPKMAEKWEVLEGALRLELQAQEREIMALEMLELGDEESSQETLRSKTTGAKIGFDEAKSHLEHFCHKLSRGEYVDARPYYMVHKSDKLMSCTVHLPSFIPPHVRLADSIRSDWKSEKNATKDAAFQAYAALYREGLVNENLLPFEPEQLPGLETRKPMAYIEPPFKPWQDIARAWQSTDDRWAYTFTCCNEHGDVTGTYDIVLPTRIDQPRTMKIHKSYDIAWELRATAGRCLSSDETSSMQDQTSALLAMNFGHRWDVLDKPHVIQVSANDAFIALEHKGSQTFVGESSEDPIRYLLRDGSGAPWIFEKVLPSKPTVDSVQRPFFEYDLAPDNVPYAVVRKWSRYADFLHPPQACAANHATGTKPYGYVIPLPCMRDEVTINHVEFGRLLPSILHEMELMLITQHLRNNLLNSIGLSNLGLIRSAISTRSANEPFQYERLEFLGDSILKYCAAVLAATLHPDWPEGYLSHLKDQLVSNARLSRAALEKGLAKYILTRPFTGHKWRPIYVDEAMSSDQQPKIDNQLSTKTLADVVEALIGASYCEGGIQKASRCLAVFIDDQEWPHPDVSRLKLFELQPPVSINEAYFAELEALLGYTFNKKSLAAEALTHPSCPSSDAQRSLDRLEFLGDAVLDKIIVSRLFKAEPPLTHDQMHLLKTATVNGDFLAFQSTEFGLPTEQTIKPKGSDLQTQTVVKPLWKYLRFESLSLGVEQKALEERHAQLRLDILDAMENGTHYPWALLAKLQAKKFFSDVVESILGAVWLDSGSIDVCEGIIGGMGILKYLDRLIRDGVHVRHPKEVIGMLAVTQKVRYTVEASVEEAGKQTFSCTICVGDREVAHVVDGVSKEEIKTKAATEAVKILEGEMKTSKAGAEAMARATE